jgi:amidophosphoribosyltransferase
MVSNRVIAASHTLDEVRAFVGADSLGYLSVGGVLAALDLPYERFCFACFDGRYPVPVPYDAAARKFVLEAAAGGTPR